MACRLYNRSSHLLRIDLRGGATLQLPPGATSAALAEEQLYDNMFLSQWERDGLIARLPARYAEVAAHASAAQKKSVERKSTVEATDKKDKKIKVKNAT